MKASLLVLAGTVSLLVSCGSSRGTGQPTVLTQAQRYDPATRSWVSADTVIVRPAGLPPGALAPEKSSESAKVLNAATAPEPATEAPATPPNAAAEKPGFIKRMGRAATSPLRMIGIGDKSA